MRLQNPTWKASSRAASQDQWNCVVQNWRFREMGRKFLQEFSYIRFRFHAAPRDMQNFHERRPLVNSPLPLVKDGKNESFEISWGQPISLASFSFLRASNLPELVFRLRLWCPTMPITRLTLTAFPKFHRPGLSRFFPKVSQRVRSLIAWALKLRPKLHVLWLLYLTGLRILQKGRARLVHHKRDVALTTRGMWLKTPERDDLINRRTWVRSSTAVCHEKFGEMHHCNKDISAVVQWLMYF